MNTTVKSKRTATVMLLLTAFSFASFAQTSKFSVSINSLTTNFNYGSSNAHLKSYKKNYQGLQAGFSYQAGITPMFSMVPEIYFAMKGGTLKEGNTITGGKSTVKINSLELPVLARLHLKKLYLNAGPYAGYNVGGRRKVEGFGTMPHSSTKVSFGDGTGDFKRWDFGWMAGAGYNFNMKQKTLTLDIRYGYGITNLTKNVDRYNRVLNISLVVSKPGKKQAERKE